MRKRDWFWSALMGLLAGIFFASLCYSATLNLKATWTPNPETDLAGYNLYRTDGGRVKINSVVIPHPPVFPYLFSITVSDNGSGALSFVLTAVDTAGNESLDSNTATYSWDTSAPIAPKVLQITK